MSKPVIEAFNLKKYFAVKTSLFQSLRTREVPLVHAVDGVTFRIFPKEILGLVGESGCGKTTTGKILLRLVEPTDGKVVFNGIDITSLSDTEMRKLRSKVQVIFQDPYESLNPRMSIYDIVAEPIENYKIAESAEETLGLVSKALEELDLTPPEEFLSRSIQDIARKAMDIAINKARSSSISVVCAYNCNHVGRLSDYTLIASNNDMFGLAVANSLSAVAPYGGVDQILSTGPISCAFPTGKGAPFVVDISTSVAAEGKIRVMLSKGEKLPEGWIIDKDGNPSTNPKDLYAGGALLPLGGDTAGRKGFGLGLVVDILAGILSPSGCAYKTEKKGNGLFFQVVDIESFISIDVFKNQIDDLIQTVKASRLRPGFKEIFIPGEPEIKNEKAKLKEGVYVSEAIWNKILDIAKKLKLDLT